MLMAANLVLEVRPEEWWEHWESLPKFDGEIDSVR